VHNILRLYKSKYFTVLLFIVFFTIPFILYFPHIQRGEYLVSGDGIAAFAVRSLLSNSLAGGEFPLWNRYIGNGVPYAGDLTNGALYLPSLLLSFLPIKLFTYVFYAFHLMLGAGFMYLFLKEIGCKQIVAMCTATLYLCSIHMGGDRKSHIIIIIVIVYLPAILFFLVKYFKERKPVWLVLSSFSMTLQFYAGFVQHTVYTDIFVFLFFVILSIKHRVKFLQFLKIVSAWILMYLGLICMQLIPTAALMSFYSTESDTTIHLFFFNLLSISFFKLPMMIFPRIFGNNLLHPLPSLGHSEMDIELFFGILVVFMLFVGVIKYRKNFWVRLCFVFMVLAYIYAMNAHIPFLNELLFKIPIINSFRSSSRILFIFIFFGYTLFAVTLSKLLETGEGKNIWKYAAAFSIFALSITSVGLFTYMATRPSIFDEVRFSYTGPDDYFVTVFLPGLIIVTVTLLLCLAGQRYISKVPPKYKGYIGVVVCGVITIVTLIQVLPFTRVTHWSPGYIFEKDTINTRIAENMEDGKVFDAINTFGSENISIIPLNTGVYKEIPTINAYTNFNNPYVFRHFNNGHYPPLNSSGYLLWFHNLDITLLQKNDLLSMLNIKYILDNNAIIGDNGATITSIFKVENPDSELTEDNYVIIEHEHTYLPFHIDEVNRVWENSNVKGILYAPNMVMPLETVDALYTGDIPYNMLEASYLTDWNGEEKDISNVIVEINIEYFKNNSIKATVYSSDETFINFSQNYFPGWRAFVNGDAVPIYMVNNIIQGVFIPGGESVLEFKFEPVPLYIGGGITIITIVIITFMLYNHSKKIKLK